jgi:hypothetical protein
MTRCKQMFSVLALVAPLAALAVMASPVTTVSEASAEQTNPNYCEALPGNCEYSLIDVTPVLRSDVCWDGETTTLKGTAPCANGGREYYLAYGIVTDPITNTVLALSPLINTCALGVCVAGELDAGDIVTDGVACCNPKTGECEPPDEDGLCTYGDITWCETIEDNGDGTITCHE